MNAVASTEFETRVQGFPTGLAGTVGVQIRDNAGGTTVARTTAGVLEDPAGSGSYVATLVAPADAGDYTILWDTGVISPSTVATDPLTVTAAAPAPPLGSSVTYLPATTDVAALLWNRTRDSNGNYPGDFTALTQPTDDDVNAVIVKAAGHVAQKIGDTVPAKLEQAAAETVALRAAMLVELSFFGDQISVSRGPYQELAKLYEAALQDLYDAKRMLGPDLEAGTADDTSVAGLPVYSFPSLVPPPYPVPGAELPCPSVTGWRW